MRLTSLVLATFLTIPAMAATSTADLMTKCQDASTREGVLQELEKESGLNFNLESLAGDDALTGIVADLQNRSLSEASLKSTRKIRRVLGIARAGVINAQKESLSQGLDKKAVTLMTGLFTSMMDIFSPVLDTVDFAAKTSNRLVSESEIMAFMTKLEGKTETYAKSLQAITDFQLQVAQMAEAEKIRLNSELDKLALNIQKQTCLAAVKEIRK